jgi:hypothetical protein
MKGISARIIVAWVNQESADSDSDVAEVSCAVCVADAEPDTDCLRFDFITPLLPTI